jgi:hypothetical protein
LRPYSTRNPSQPFIRRIEFRSFRSSHRYPPRRAPADDYKHHRDLLLLAPQSKRELSMPASIRRHASVASATASSFLSLPLLRRWSCGPRSFHRQCCRSVASSFRTLPPLRRRSCGLRSLVPDPDRHSRSANLSFRLEK